MCSCQVHTGIHSSPMLNLLTPNPGMIPQPSQGSRLTRQQVVDSSASQPLEQAGVGETQLHAGVVSGGEAALLLVAELGVGRAAVGPRGQDVKAEDLRQGAAVQIQLLQTAACGGEGEDEEKERRQIRQWIEGGRKTGSKGKEGEGDQAEDRKRESVIEQTCNGGQEINKAKRITNH